MRFKKGAQTGLSWLSSEQFRMSVPGTVFPAGMDGGLCCKLIAVQPFSLLSPAAFIHLQKVFLSKLPRNNMHANLCMRVGFLKKQHNTFGTRSCLRKQILKPHFACIAHWLAESENHITCAVPERLLSCQC